MRLAWGLDEHVAGYLTRKFPVAARRGGFRPFRAVGIVTEDGTLCGGVLMTDYRGNDGCLTIFLEPTAFLTKGMLAELFHEVFRVLHMKRVTAEVAKRNKRARRYVEGLGFRLEGTLRYAWHDGLDDMCLYGMTYDACKWVNHDASRRA